MLTFCNGYTEEIWVAYMFYSPGDCGGEGKDWQTIGWFSITPKACTIVYANDLKDVNNRYWYYYAENASRSFVWAGPTNVYVTDKAFNHCFGIGTSTSRIVGFRILDVGRSNNYTLTLQ